MNRTEPSLDYASSPPPERRPITSGSLTIALGVPVGVLLFCTFAVMPRIEQTFMDFKVELPQLTQWSLLFTRWVSSWGWSVLVLIPVIVPIILTQLMYSPHPRTRRMGHAFWSINIALLLSLLVVAWFAVAMLLPMVHLIQTVSSPAG